MLSAAFIGQGVESLLNPKPAAQAAAPAVAGLRTLPEPMGSRVPADPETVAQINAAVQIGGGLLLATGRLPRLASAALALTVVPGRLGAHMFLERARPGPQSPEATGVSHRRKPARRTDHRVRRYRGQAVIGLAGPAGRRAAVRRGVFGSTGV
ncbi:hypothetical protein NJB1728e18_17820 [Mycobacterium marinum]|nr:hypothetical protein NJB1728e18_17820 [Mycobacterium marinum]GJP00610.1 hypothetical protein NJB1728e22_04040 [Mycobacterium marinum]